VGSKGYGIFNLTADWIYKVLLWERRETEKYYTVKDWPNRENFLVNNQLDASVPFNIFIDFQLSTCFEPYVLIIRRDQIVSTQLLVIVTPC
jgi:hypothetical protein